MHNPIGKGILCWLIGVIVGVGGVYGYHLWSYTVHPILTLTQQAILIAEQVAFGVGWLLGIAGLLAGSAGIIGGIALVMRAVSGVRSAKTAAQRLLQQAEAQAKAQAAQLLAHAEARAAERAAQIVAEAERIKALAQAERVENARYRARLDLLKESIRAEAKRKAEHYRQRIAELETALVRREAEIERLKESLQRIVERKKAAQEKVVEQFVAVLNQVANLNCEPAEMQQLCQEDRNRVEAVLDPAWTWLAGFYALWHDRKGEALAD